MARRAPGGVPRPRELRVELEPTTRPYERPGRLTPLGRAIVAGLAAAALAFSLFYALGYVGGHL